MQCMHIVIVVPPTHWGLPLGTCLSKWLAALPGLHVRHTDSTQQWNTQHWYLCFCLEIFAPAFPCRCVDKTEMGSFFFACWIGISLLRNPRIRLSCSNCAHSSVHRTVTLSLGDGSSGLWIPMGKQSQVCSNLWILFYLQSVEEVWKWLAGLPVTSGSMPRQALPSSSWQVWHYVQWVGVWVEITHIPWLHHPIHPFLHFLVHQLPWLELTLIFLCLSLNVMNTIKGSKIKEKKTEQR